MAEPTTSFSFIHSTNLFLILFHSRKRLSLMRTFFCPFSLNALPTHLLQYIILYHHSSLSRCHFLPEFCMLMPPFAKNFFFALHNAVHRQRHTNTCKFYCDRWLICCVLLLLLLVLVPGVSRCSVT